MDRLEVRALLSSGTPELVPLVFVEQGITVDNSLDEETFLKTLEETLQQHVTSLNQQFLVLSAAQVDRLAFRLHDALVPKRDAETRIVQAWTIQPQIQLKVKASAHLQVLKLSTILREVQRLRLHQSQTEIEEAQNPIEVEIFSSLRFLEVLKTEARSLKNVHYFSSQLRDLHIEHTEVTTLRQLLAPNPDECKPWRKLLKLQMNCCELQLVDDSLNLLKAVKTLDLGWNKIERVETDVALKSLHVLSLCHNKLHSVPRMQSLRALRELDLAVNQISSLKGLETLTALERLDVSHNLIRSISEVELLTRLPRLTFLKMEFNPIARRPDYRREVLFYLGELIELDGQRWNVAELGSMKYRRMLMMSEERSSESPIWKQSAEVFVYPKASCRVDFPLKSPALVLGYPPLPQAKGIPAHFVEIQNSQSTFPTKSGNLGVAIGSRSEEENGRSRSFLKGRGMHEYQKPPQTVDDYFKYQRHFTVTTTSRQRTKSYDLSTTREREDSHDFDTNTIAQLNQEHSLSDFMCDFKEQELVMSECNVNDIDDAFATSPTQEPGHNINVRILLSEKEATRLGLHFEVDGIPANVEIKSQVLIESYSFSDGTELKSVHRWLRDVVAIGTLMHSSRQTIKIKLQVRGSSEVMDAAYQFDTMTSLEALWSLLVVHLYKQYKGRIVIMKCAHCGALSLLTPKYPARADDALSVYSCLLCLSCNLREISYKKLRAICSDESVTIPSNIPLAPPRKETIFGGFYIEETTVKDSSSDFGMCECVMISCYGIREVAALTNEQGGGNEASNDELNDAIVHAITST